jgi:hypothetical protein
MIILNNGEAGKPMLNTYYFLDIEVFIVTFFDLPSRMKPSDMGWIVKSGKAENER